MMAYCCKKLGEKDNLKKYLEAGRRIIKDRQDVLGLTSGSTLSYNSNPLEKPENESKVKRMSTIDTVESSPAWSTIKKSKEKEKYRQKTTIFSIEEEPPSKMKKKIVSHQ